MKAPGSAAAKQHHRLTSSNRGGISRDDREGRAIGDNGLGLEKFKDGPRNCYYYYY